MSDTCSFGKYDEVLTSILVNEKSIIGFLSTIFNFLARRTDFYYVPHGPHENMGFPPGVAEELVVTVLRRCDPINSLGSHCVQEADAMNDVMCSTVAQEVEVIADEDQQDVDNLAEGDTIHNHLYNKDSQMQNNCRSDVTESTIKAMETCMIKNDECSTELDPNHAQSKTKVEEFPNDKVNDRINEPPVIPVQKNSETYNGAERENYCWSQTITDLDITVKLLPNIKSAKDLKVTINSGDVCVACRSGEVIFNDSLPYKIKPADSFWSVSEGKLLIHLEKCQDRWWNRFLSSEEPIDLSKIDCSRSLYDLPEDHIAKVHEIQWNQEQKLKGLPTSDQLRNIEILKKAWNAEGSPFKGQEFNPNILNN